MVQRADPTFDDDLQDWLRRAHNWLSKPKGTTNYYKLLCWAKVVFRPVEEISRQPGEIQLIKEACCGWSPWGSWSPWACLALQIDPTRAIDDVG